MFMDWLKMSQEHDHDLPVVTDIVIETICTETGERLSTRQPWFRHEGSHSTSIKISVSGRKVTVDGNPSRFDRLDNLFGYSHLEQCVAVYNRLLREYGLPEFTKCTRVEHRQGEDGEKVSTWADGAYIERIDLTTNVGVGQGNVPDYLRALSGQRLGHSIGHLYENGCTVEWKSKQGNARLQRRIAYDKANELNLHLLPRLKRSYGPTSDEYLYACSVRDYCLEHGVVRMEQKLNSELLQRENLRYWGLGDEARLKTLHEEFLSVDDRLQVTAMDFETISQKLLSEVPDVTTLRAANTTAMYAVQWMHGQKFDLGKAQVKLHRARLRKIGIDIANVCDLSKFSLVTVKRVAEVVPIKQLTAPAWYRRPVNHLSVAA